MPILEVGVMQVPFNVLLPVKVCKPRYKLKIYIYYCSLGMQHASRKLEVSELGCHVVTKVLHPSMSTKWLGSFSSFNAPTVTTLLLVTVQEIAVPQVALFLNKQKMKILDKWPFVAAHALVYSGCSKPCSMESWSCS